MHPTADTKDFINSESLWAAGDAGRSAAQSFKILDGGLPLAAGRGSFPMMHTASIRRAALRVIYGEAWRMAGRSEVDGSRAERHSSTAPPNNGMHPTADTSAAKFVQWFGAAGDAWRSAAQSFKIPDGDLRFSMARGSFTSRRSSFAQRAALRIILHGAWQEMRRFEYRGSREGLFIRIRHPNNGMHPTADTLLITFLGGTARRVMRGVRAA